MEVYTLVQNRKKNRMTKGKYLALYPGLPMFFNIHKKTWEGLVDFGDIMDVVCDDARWNE